MDLDGAFAGEPVHRQQVQDIVTAVPGHPVQIGGGVRSLEAAGAYLEAGASQVIAGTRALEDAEFLHALARQLPGQVILGLDARDGRIATRGWTAGSDVAALPSERLLGVISGSALYEGTLDFEAGQRLLDDEP